MIVAGSFCCLAGIAGPKNNVAALTLSILLRGGRAGYTGWGRVKLEPPLIRRFGLRPGEPLSDEEDAEPGDSRSR